MAVSVTLNTLNILSNLSTFPLSLSYYHNTITTTIQYSIITLLLIIFNMTQSHLGMNPHSNHHVSLAVASYEPTNNTNTNTNNNTNNNNSNSKYSHNNYYNHYFYNHYFTCQKKKKSVTWCFLILLMMMSWFMLMLIYGQSCK